MGKLEDELQQDSAIGVSKFFLGASHTDLNTLPKHSIYPEKIKLIKIMQKILVAIFSE